MLDPTRTLVLCALIGWTGWILLLTNVGWFCRASLVSRLQPYTGPIRTSPVSPSLDTLKEALLPVATSTGERLGKLFGLSDDLESRLRRAYMEITPGAFRLRQFTSGVAAVCIGALVAFALDLPPSLALAFVAGSPLLSFLVLEQQVISKTHRRQRRLFMELPIVSEQLATLLGAGYSLGAALNRIAERNMGVIGRDIDNVCDRVRQGLGINDALQEWAERAAVPELDRLVAVLSFGSETSDLGRLVSGEAETTRNEAHRRLSELIDKRSQQVWIPVTVATLVPGVIFLSIPFLHALRQFSAG